MNAYRGCRSGLDGYVGYVRGEVGRGKGVPVLQIYEVYEYQVTQYNPETGEVGLFVDCINNLLKLKAKASGYLGWVRNPADEDLYVETFWKNEGISLYR